MDKPMLNGGKPYDDSQAPDDSTFEERYAHAIRYGQSNGQSAREIREDAQAAEVRREIERRVNEYVLKLLAQRIAETQARKARKATQASKVKVAARPADLHAHYQQLRHEGYSALDAAEICGRYLNR